ncbi:MAG: MmgE/PrpD family protein [Dehalococcoidia bacterium]|nr:MmgE/PrpD family protein [Dehalococcoidia bacterium]
MDSITEQLAGYVAGLKYEALPASTRHAATVRIIDSLGCALGGYGGEPARIARGLAATRRSANGATVLGSGGVSTPEAAAFANGVMVRYLDCNDTHIGRGLAHPSDMIPAVLAAVEIASNRGADVITSVVAAYQVFDAVGRQLRMSFDGWDQSMVAALGAAAGAGKALGLDHAQLGHAMAIAATANVATGQTRTGELSMWKGCATAYATAGGLFAAIVAQQGMSGPSAAFEGKSGLQEMVTGPLSLDVQGLGAGQPAVVEQTSLKYFPAQYDAQALIWMALELGRQVQVADIASIEVQTYAQAKRAIAGDPAKWNPQSRETADHSLPYLMAVALTDGEVTERSFTPERIADPQLRRLMQRITVSENPEFTQQSPAAMVSETTVRTVAGRLHTVRSTYPKGHPRNPMTDRDLEAKFRLLAAPLLGAGGCDAALVRLWRLGQSDDVSGVLRSLVAHVPNQGMQEQR